MTPLEAYYNKFNEEKRLNSRHGRIEFRTTWDYIHAFMPEGRSLSIADIGAGTGRYALPLAMEGHHVTAVEPVQHNLGRLQQKIRQFHQENPEKPLSLETVRGNALSLKKLPDESFDATLFLGPMYHLTSEEDKLTALSEAKRITKPGGPIFVAYLLNEYGVLIYGIREGHLKEALSRGLVDENFHITEDEDGLYSYVRLEDIDSYNERTGLLRKKILTPDGPSNYLRREINALDEESFEEYYRYHRSICERKDLLGAAAHILDVVTH